MSADLRLVDRVIVHPGGCWSTTGRLHVRAQHTYRRMYRIFRGEPEHLLHHICWNPGCVNPWHLEDITRANHTLLHPRGPNRVEKERCPKGHLWSENTYVHPKSGRRECTECCRLHRRALKEVA